MDYHAFSARLCANYNNVSEYGQAVLGPRPDEVDFTGDFVPLLPLDTTATIDWILGDEVVASYTGRVYLSSPMLVRIVGVDTETTRAARFTLAQNTTLPATIVPLYSGPRAAVHRPAEAQIIYLARERMTLLCSDIVQEGQQLLLSAEVDFLTLRELALLVRRRVLMRRGQVLLICEVLSGSNDNVIALSAYSSRLEKLGEGPGGEAE